MGIWYRAGTVAVTSGSKTVTGTGTQWQNLIFGVAPGVTFYGPDGKPYEIDTVNSNTSLTLVTNYSGATASGQAYAIDPTRSGSVASLAAQTSEVLKFSQGQFTQIQNWFTGAASANVTLTSPAGQQVTVPSYLKVTSEGEGQAARAKTEADKAAASAALAGDIVAASALPLPDVWAPLSDSLRMITGYGREVKVGDDVVARMLTFSRSSTKTYTNLDGALTISPVNAPTFDRRGLLLEGQSQNLVVRSEKSPRTLEAGAYTISPSAVQGYNLHSCVYNSGDDALIVDTAATLQAADGAGSFVFNSATIVGNWICHFNDTDSYVGFWPKNSSVFEYEDLGKGLIRASRKLKGTTLNTLHFRCWKVPGSRIEVGCYQIESLPVASSYIPTSGSVSTRTADLLTLQNPLNIPPSAGDMTVAFEVRRNPALPSAWFPKIFHIGTHTWLVGDSVRFAMRGGTADQGQVLKNAPGTMETVVYRIAGDQITVRCGNGVAILTRTGAITWNNTVTNIGSDATGVQNLFGYVRNLRVWRRALTDDQMKAIA